MAATQKQAYQSRRHLPADLFPEILSRLPVKSLLRFRCVSKPWLSLVDDDSDFARLHLKTLKNNRHETGLFVVQTGIQHGRPVQECVVRCSHEFKPISEIPFKCDAWHVVTSLHGLVLLKYRTHSNTIGHFGDLRVWNPSIRKLLEIPPLLEPQTKVSPTDLLMDKDIGLGYDPVANNYKLVKLICYNNTLHSVASYAVGTCSWKIINCSNWQWVMCSFQEAVYFRGSLYFIASNTHKDRGWDLVWFDLNKEVFSSSRLPDDRYFNTSHHNWRRLASVGDGFVVEAFDISSSEVYVWVVDTESMCWKKPHLYSWRGYYLFHIKKNGDMLKWRICDDVTSTADGKGEVTSYSRETEENTTLQLRLDFRICHVSCYVESLILHKMNQTVVIISGAC